MVVPNSTFNARVQTRALNEENRDRASSWRLLEAATTSARDVADELFNNELLIGDDRFDKITDGYDAD